MNRLLRELQQQLHAMDQARRARVVQGIRSVIVGMLAMREAGLTLSKLATSKAAGQLMIWGASESLPEIIEHVKEQAKEVGEDVYALFHSI